MRAVRQKAVRQKSVEQNTVPTMTSLIVSLLAGAVFVFALAPYHIWGVALLSPLILYVLLLMKISNRQAFAIGLSFGVGLWVTGAFWLYTSIHTYGNISAWLAILMIAVLAVIMGLFHGAMAWIFVKFLGRQPLAFAAIWVVQEWLKTWLLTGFPWLFVGYAYTELPFVASFAPIGGVLLISFIGILVSSSIAEALNGRLSFLLMSCAVVMIGVLLHWLSPAYTTPTGQTLSVSLIQGNIPQDVKWLVGHRQQTLDIYEQMSKSEWGRDLVVWPEGAIPMFQSDAKDFLSAISKTAKSSHSVFITGIPYQDASERQGDFVPFYNSALALGSSEGVYKKQHLVPFGEYTPLHGLLNILPNLANSGLGHSAGKDNQPAILIKGKPVGIAICYEVAYPNTTRLNAKDSEFLLTISNDAWFGTSTGPYQHLQMVRMRSLETGRWFVRATNNGIDRKSVV